jgi:hypothetical protein
MRIPSNNNNTNRQFRPSWKLLSKKRHRTTTTIGMFCLTCIVLYLVSLIILSINAPSSYYQSNIGNYKSSPSISTNELYSTTKLSSIQNSKNKQIVLLPIEEQENKKKTSQLLLSSLNLLNKPIIVFQTDTRLGNLWNTKTTSNNIHSILGNFSTSIVGPSILSMYHWSKLNGYGYFFLEVSNYCEGLKHPTYSQQQQNNKNTNTTILNKTWCKVPSLIYALQIATLAGAKWLFYVDTDVGPQQQQQQQQQQQLNQQQNLLLNHVIDCLSEESHLILLLADGQAWDCEATESYPLRGTINTGVMLLRVSEKTKEVLHKWWYELPHTRTHFEKNWDHSVIQINRKFVDNIELLNSAIDNLALEIHKQFETTTTTGGDNVIVSFSKVNPFLLRLYPQGKKSEPGSPLWQWCCEEKNCLRILSKGMTMSKKNQDDNLVRCEHFIGDTMIQWPGDQDRLNYLFNEEGHLPVQERIIKAQFPGICNQQEGKYQTDEVFKISNSDASIQRAQQSYASFESEMKQLWNTKHYYDYTKATTAHRTKWMFNPPRHSCDMSEYSCNDGTTIGATSLRPSRAVVFHWTMPGKTNGKNIFSMQESVQLYQIFQQELLLSENNNPLSFDEWNLHYAWQQLKLTLPAIRFRPCSSTTTSTVCKYDVVKGTLKNIEEGLFDVL